ncbi:MAG: MFS transporter [Gemmatimonadaceae bacterium]
MNGFLSARFSSFQSGNVGKLAVLMATAFIDMVGNLIVLPLLPFYAERLGASGPMLGALVASFSLAQLVSAPLWGRVSDHYGRRPALLIGLSSSAVAYVVFAFADSYWLLLLSRIVQGAGGGTTGVIQAYVADALQPKDRARGLGWLSAATNLGVVLGPTIGSFSSTLGAQWPGLIAAGLCLVNIAFASRFLSESHGVAARAKAKLALTPRQAMARVLAHPGQAAPRLIWMYAIGIGAFYGVTVFMTLFLGRRFGVTAQTIGFFFTYIGLLNVVFRIGLLGFVVDQLGEVKTARVGAVLLSVGLASIPFTTTVWMLAMVVALLPLGTTLLFPSVTALLSQVVAEHERGLYMGVQQTYGGVSRVLFPPIAGFAWDHLGIGVPFWFSGALVAFTLVLGLNMEHRVTIHHAAETERVAKEEAAKEQAAVAE